MKIAIDINPADATRCGNCWLRAINSCDVWGRLVLDRFDYLRHQKCVEAEVTEPPARTVMPREELEQLIKDIRPLARGPRTRAVLAEYEEALAKLDAEDGERPVVALVGYRRGG